MRHKIIFSIIVLAIAVGSMAASTLAWFTAESTLFNEFTAGTVVIEAEETIFPPAHIVSNWNPGDCTIKEFTVTNSGSKSIFIRAIITGSWFNKDGSPFEPDPGQEVVTYELSDSSPHQDWIRQGDKWYYEFPLPGTYTGATLIERQVTLRLKVCLDGPGTSNQYQGKVFKLSAVFEAVQSSHDAVDHAWPDNPLGSGSDGGNLDYSQLFEMAVFVDESVRLGGSTQITGDVGINSIAPHRVEMGWSTRINGNLLLGPGGDPDTVINKPVTRPYTALVTGYIDQLTSLKSFAMPAYPANLPPYPGNIAINTTNGNYTITSDGYYPGISIEHGRALVVDTGSGDRVIRVGTLGLGYGRIELQGSGRLLLYVENIEYLEGLNMTINQSGSASRMLMFYQGSNVNFGLSTAAVFRGGLFAPNAHVTLLSSSRIVGSVVARSLDAGDGSRVAVTYEPINP